MQTFIDTTQEPPKKKKKKSKHPIEDNDSVAAKSSAKPASTAEINAFLTKNAIAIFGDVTPILSFDALTLPPALRGAFADFKEPTPIQACCWPPALEGRDVVGIAETGSGKTLAFGIPALSRLNENPTNGVSVLVVAPTRELAIQTHDTMSSLGQHLGISSVAIFGGVDKGPQVRQLAGKGKFPTKIVVGTPGRILDLVNDRALDLSGYVYAWLVFSQSITDMDISKGKLSCLRRS